MKAKLLNKIKLSDRLWTFEFITKVKLDYIAGQFVELKIDNSKKVPLRRWFTLSSSPTENNLAITTIINSDITSDFKRELYSLNIGQIVDISQAMGDFVLTRDSTEKLTFIAFGIGVTPFRSIIKQLSDTKSKRDISLIYISKSENKLPFEDIFTNYLIDRVFKYSNLEELVKSPFFNKISNSDHIYISGAEEKVMNLRDKLIASEAKEDSIFCDYFPGY